jgi:hypothetical protein
MRVLWGFSQTLRELGRLPLAVVGRGGSLVEFLEGSGSGAEECPWIYDHEKGKSARVSSCDRMRVPTGTSCNPAKDSWCQDGAVVSVARDDANTSPLIVTYTKQSTTNVWSHLYDSISSDQQALTDLDGSCFEDVVIGKTSTLNFYQVLNSTAPVPSTLQKVPRINNTLARVDAMAAFKAFIISSQREWVKRNNLKFSGYKDAGLEVLRKGLGELSESSLAAINAKECRGVIREEINELKKAFAKHQELVRPSVVQFESRYDVVVPQSLTDDRALKLRDEESESFFVADLSSDQVSPEGLRNQYPRDHREPESHGTSDDLPVVTYMSRNFFSRGIVNEVDILRYILSNYKVMLRVTTFQEPLLEVMELLSSSDVLFGMHGAGWTNALFMKRGATTMQMYPHGWRLPDNSTVRGYNYREIVYASEGKYLEWVNPSRENSYFRRIDFKKRKESKFQLHPQEQDPLPQNSWPGNQWIYQNTYVDMSLFGREIDRMMAIAGIPHVRET